VADAGLRLAGPAWSAIAVITPLANRVAYYAHVSLEKGQKDPRAEARACSWLGRLAHRVLILVALYFGGPDAEDPPMTPSRRDFVRGAALAGAAFAFPGADGWTPRRAAAHPSRSARSALGPG